jgi:signal transduction histidine kinase
MNLRALARAVVDEFRSAQPAATLELRATGNLTGEWDQARIRQVLSNLIGNALQHGDVATPIAVSLRGHRSHVTLAIRNHGPPIPPAELPRIFDPLVRGAGSDTPRRNRPGSIGLGLYIVRELVAAHGGTVAVTSHPTAGTAFTIHLPRHAARQRAPSRKSSRQSAKRPR